MKNHITLNSIVFLSKEQVSCDLADEAVILGLKDNVYYGLNSLGAFIWDFIKEPRKVEEVLTKLLEEFDVEKEECKNDLLELLEELNQKGLIEVKHEAIV